MDGNTGLYPAPANDTAVEDLPFARLRGGATPNGQRGVTESYTGTLDVADRTVVPLAYVKDLNPKQLFNEVLGIRVGRALGLPMPRAYWVVAEPSQGPWKHGPTIGPSGERLLFATDAIVKPKTLAAHLTGLGHVGARELAQWPQLGEAVAFDEWLANPDRHGGNLLVAGDGSFWLIDHSHILTGDSWTAATLSTAAGNGFDNQLASVVASILTPTERASEKAAAQAAAVKQRLLGVGAMLSGDLHGMLIPSGDVGAIVAFLQARLAHMTTLLAVRF